MTSIKELEEEVEDLKARLEDMNARVQKLTATTLATPPAATPAAGAGEAPVERAYETVDAWVDDVFVELAARKQYAWCPKWRAHPEAHARLTQMWRAWEFANAKVDTDLQAMENWHRLVFDHHVTVLLDRAGPFADCTDGHSQRFAASALAKSDYSDSEPSDAAVAAAVAARFGPEQTVNLTDQGGER